MWTVVVAEKPSVARDIAGVLGATKKCQGYLEGAGYRVTWAIGHLVSLPQPHEVDTEWKRWSWAHLPMLPQEWPLQVIDRTASQFHIIEKLLKDRQTGLVVAATDAGREGELIFRYIYERSGARVPVQRLWISSLTEGAIRQGFARLKDGPDYDPLADAAKARSRADWLVGMNLSRAYSLAHGDTFSVGRVQTPTLAMLVERDLTIRDFVPETYFEVQATFCTHGDKKQGRYKGTWFDNNGTRLAADGVQAQAIVERAHAATKRSEGALIESLKAEKKQLPSPRLYDLTELQRHANRLFGFSAKRTLELAQTLYEKHKAISYPRTDSRHLSTEMAQQLPAVVTAIREPYEGKIADGTGQRPLSKRFVDDAEVGEHHAIIPTASKMRRLAGDEFKIYDLICRRLLQAWHGPYESRVTTAVTVIETTTDDGQIKDRYKSSGRAVEQQGWKVLDFPSKADRNEILLPAGLKKNQVKGVDEARVDEKQTRPPKPHTDASLLSGMEGAGRSLEDRELSRAMRECGLGTPATRAAVIETLISREYVRREKRALRATDKGIRLIELVHPEVKSPALTGGWEARLERIARRDEGLPAFMADIEAFVRQRVAEIAEASPGRAFGSKSPPPKAGPSATATRMPPNPTPSPASTGAAVAVRTRKVSEAGPMKDILRDVFGFSEFRPNQEAVCEAVRAGKPALLVMPTGAGKSLCYQLPGLARGGTTVVLSPLIALMEDQVSKLQALGLAAERIHSGRSRQQSREVCRAYLLGALDFLFIAPERLGVPGFPEMLGKRPPTLIAVDEAHCISNWGHDFRPDYRMLKERLPLLGDAPVLALTATATPQVQRDIVRQLGTAEAQRFIHGFRRTNIAVEVAEVSQPERADRIEALLEDPSQRPAIVYAPTRKVAEELADQLGHNYPVAAYHAGLSPAARDRTQSEFLGGNIEVVVATIAFGMGIDKADVRTVVHAALPSSVEGYYQEIGRAGRDGAPSTAVLLYSYGDKRTHQFFFDRDHPETKVLQRIAKKLGPDPVLKDELRGRVRLDPEDFDRAFDKLLSHGAVIVDRQGGLTRGDSKWRKSYEAQREHRLKQLQLISDYADSQTCRMLQLVQHFGDEEDSGRDCGLCDICAPAEARVQRFRAPQDHEIAAIECVLETLKTKDGQALGRLFEAVGSSWSRGAFEGLLKALERANYLVVEENEFEKDGQSITYRRARLSATGRWAVGSAGRIVQDVQFC